MNDSLTEADAEVVRHVEQLGGCVDYSGDEYFDVNLGSLHVAGPNLRPLARLRRPFTVSLLESRFGESDLGELRDCEFLTGLILAFTPVTDGVAAVLAGHPTLEVLDLSGTRVSDAVLPALAGWPALTGLNLCGTAITDAGLASLRGCAKLTALGLAQTAVTDAAVPELARFAFLRSLSLHDTKVTGAGFAAIVQALPQCGIHR